MCRGLYPTSSRNTCKRVSHHPIPTRHINNLCYTHQSARRLTQFRWRFLPSVPSPHVCDLAPNWGRRTIRNICRVRSGIELCSSAINPDGLRTLSIPARLRPHQEGTLPTRPTVGKLGTPSHRAEFTYKPERRAHHSPKIMLKSAKNDMLGKKSPSLDLNQHLQPTWPWWHWALHYAIGCLPATAGSGGGRTRILSSNSRVFYQLNY